MQQRISRRQQRREAHGELASLQSIKVQQQLVKANLHARLNEMLMSNEEANSRAHSYRDMYQAAMQQRYALVARLSEHEPRQVSTWLVQALSTDVS